MFDLLLVCLMHYPIFVTAKEELSPSLLHFNLVHFFEGRSSKSDSVSGALHSRSVSLRYQIAMRADK